MKEILRMLSIMAALSTGLVVPVSWAQDKRMQTVQLGPIELDVLASLVWDNDKGALVGKLSGSDELLVHISGNLIQRNGEPVAGASPIVIAAQAKDEGIPVERSGNVVWYRKSMPAPQGEAAAEVHLWYAGFESYGVMISCVIDAKLLSTDDARTVLESIPQTINSLRSPNKTVEPTR